MSSAIFTFFFLLASNIYALQPTEDSNLQNIINNFLCSDNVQEMVSHANYPFYRGQFKRIYNRRDLANEIEIAKRDPGIYKLGKGCIGFHWDIKAVRELRDYEIDIETSDGVLSSTIFIDKNNWKINGLFVVK